MKSILILFASVGLLVGCSDRDSDGQLSYPTKWVNERSACSLCGKTTGGIGEHCTMYSPHQGCFPLCQDCWSKLTPSERLPYYRGLFDFWRSSDATGRQTATNGLWLAISNAVMEGK